MEKAREVIEAAIRAEEAGDSDEAIRLYEHASLLAPNSSHLRLRLAFLHFERAEWKHAIRVGREVIKRWPQIPGAYTVVGESYARLDHSKMAERFYREAVHIEEDPNVFVLYGCLLHDLERNDEAEETLRKALQLKPDHYEAHYNLARVYQAKGNFARAESHLKLSIEIKPNYALAYALLGMLLAGQKHRTKEAVGILQKAIDYRPDDVWSIAYLADAFARLSELDAADEQYHRLLEIWPDHPLPYWAYGDFLARESDDISTAEHYLRKAVEIDPKDPIPNYFLGKHLFFWDRKEEAKRFLREAARLGHLTARELLGKERVEADYVFAERMAPSV